MKGMNGHFWKVEQQMAHKHRKRSSTALATRKLKLQGNSAAHSLEGLKLKKTWYCQHQVLATGILIHHEWECKLVQLLWKIV